MDTIKKKLIYTAGKYSGETYSEIDDNIRKAEHVAIQLWVKGWGVICPHKNTAHLGVFEAVANISYEDWLEADLEMIRRCDAIFMLKDWRESNGAKREHALAIEIGIPIYYNIADVPNLKENK